MIMAAPVAYLYGQCRAMGFCMCRGVNGCSDPLATTPERMEQVRTEPIRKAPRFNMPTLHRIVNSASPTNDECLKCGANIAIADLEVHMKFAHGGGQ